MNSSGQMPNNRNSRRGLFFQLTENYLLSPVFFFKHNLNQTSSNCGIVIPQWDWPFHLCWVKGPTADPISQGICIWK